MKTTILILILFVAFGILIFVAIYLVAMKKEADKYIDLKQTTKQLLSVKKERLLKRLSKTQLNTLINALKN